MKKYQVTTTVETINGESFTKEPVELNEKELENTLKDAYNRTMIHITVTKPDTVKHIYIPMKSILFFGLTVKELPEVTK